MITAHFFTFGGDAPLLPHVVRAWIQTMDRTRTRCCALAEYRTVVIDDAMQPCPADVRRGLEEAGVEWRESSWRRNGNLNGHACITGMLDEMLSSLSDSEAADDIAVKIDTDVIIRGVDWLNHFALDPLFHFTAADDRGSAYGMCYALRWQAASMVRESLRICPAGEMSPEDQVIGYRARLLCGEEAFLHIPLQRQGRLPGLPNGPWGIVAPYNWQSGDPFADAEDEYACAQIINLRPGLPHVPMGDLVAAARRFVVSH